MRVAHVITRLIIGGAQENTIATVLGLHKNPEFEPVLFSGFSKGPEGSLESTLSDNPALLQRVPHLIRPIHPWHDILALGELRQALRAFRPDLVHTHSGKAGILGRMAARRERVPLIVHTIHGPSFGAFQSAPANVIFRAAERHAARFTTHFVSVANAMTRQYLAAGIGSAAQYSRILSGFDLTPFLAAQPDSLLRFRLKLAPDDVVATMIARLVNLKGHAEVLSLVPGLVKKNPRLKFLLVGDGYLRAQLEKAVAENGLEGRVLFAGMVPPGDIPRYLGVSDFLIHWSKREGLPRVVPQALAAGRPVVACDCDGSGEVCFDGETGFLVQPGDLRTLGERILQLSADAGLRKRLAAAGRAFVEKHFAVNTMVEEIAQLYRRLAADRPVTK